MSCTLEDVGIRIVAKSSERTTSIDLLLSAQQLTLASINAVMSRCLTNCVVNVSGEVEAKRSSCFGGWQPRDVIGTAFRDYCAHHGLETLHRNATSLNEMLS